MLAFDQLLRTLLLVTSVIGSNGCRLCTGDKTLTFDNFVVQDVAQAFLGNSFDGCVTGAEFEVTDVTPGGNNILTSCLANGVACKEWKFKLDIYRYCGNGGGVQMTKGRKCVGPVCALSDFLDLKCNRSVRCGSDCDCKNCGC